MLCYCSLFGVEHACVSEEGGAGCYLSIHIKLSFYTCVKEHVQPRAYNGEIQEFNIW